MNIYCAVEDSRSLGTKTNEGTSTGCNVRAPGRDLNLSDMLNRVLPDSSDLSHQQVLISAFIQLRMAIPSSVRSMMQRARLLQYPDHVAHKSLPIFHLSITAIHNTFDIFSDSPS